MRIFASELVPLTGDDKSLLSRMFCKTFAVSSKTSLADIHWHACRFWGLIHTEFSLYVDNRASQGGLDLWEGDELHWKINALPDLAANEGEDAVLM